jgi:hypothetical protein
MPALDHYGLAADLDNIISDETGHKEETEKLRQAPWRSE